VYFVSNATGGGKPSGGLWRVPKVGGSAANVRPDVVLSTSTYDVLVRVGTDFYENDEHLGFVRFSPDPSVQPQPVGGVNGVDATAIWTVSDATGGYVALDVGRDPHISRTVITPVPTAAGRVAAIGCSPPLDSTTGEGQVWGMAVDTTYVYGIWISPQQKWAVFRARR
jgi:hypothetical protein